MVGLARGTVDLHDHDPVWRDEYEREVARLRDLLGDRIRDFEHVGSTAVAGVPAKPVVDVLALVDDLADATELVPVLEREGYAHRANDDVEDRVFLAKGPPTNRTHYLSITAVGSDTHREQVAFRDYLREHPETASAYATLKRSLASEYPDDRASYTAAKAPFIERVLADAL
ncbi:MAG: GrpB family protein [Halopenitus sp.]